MLLKLFISLISGILIESFFQLIKYRDDFDNNGPIPAYQNFNRYISVTQFVAGGERRWINYIIFRALPPTIVFILTSSIYTRYLNDNSLLLYLTLSAVISLFFRDFISLINTKIFAEKLVHIVNIGIVIFIAFIVSVISSFIDLSFFAPTIQGLVDNLWSTLLISILIVFYLKTTSQSQPEYIKPEMNRMNNYVINSYNFIKEKFGNLIFEYSTINNCSIILIYSVLIMENMNRPKFIRFIEKFLVKFFHFELSIGIAQIRSNIILTDEESIIKATEILKDSNMNFDEDTLSQFKLIIDRYNIGEEYKESIIQIMRILTGYHIF